MPIFRDVTVHILDLNEKPLEEWGTRNLKGKNICSCYIESVTNLQFKISVTPKIPFATEYPMRKQEAKTKGGKRIVDVVDLVSDDEQEIAGEESEPMDTAASDSVPTEDVGSEPRNKSKRTPRAPPFHFLATLYLDGRTKPERSMIVYLDPLHPDFATFRPPRRLGETIMSSRWVQGDDGRIHMHQWVFKDVGIETLFDKLQLDGAIASEGKICHKDEDDIVAAMHKTGLDDQEERPGQGQILVTIERVVLGRPYEDPAYRPHLRQGEADVKMGEEEGLSHTTGFTAGRPMAPDPVRVVRYYAYDRPKQDGTPAEPYAAFQFFYRSKEILRKFNFTNFPAASDERHRKKASKKEFAQRMSYMTPLSISHATSPPSTTRGTTKDKPRSDSFDGASATPAHALSRRSRRASEVPQRPTTTRQSSRDERPMLDSYRPGQSTPPHPERPMLDSYRPGNGPPTRDSHYRSRGDSYRPVYATSSRNDLRPSDGKDASSGIRVIRKSKLDGILADPGDDDVPSDSISRPRDNDTMDNDDENHDSVSLTSSLSSTPIVKVQDQQDTHRNKPITFPYSSSPTIRFPDTLSFKARSKSPLLIKEGDKSPTSATASSSNLLSASTADAHRNSDTKNAPTLGPTYTGYRASPNDPSDADDEADSPRTVRTRPGTSVSGISGARDLGVAARLDSDSQPELWEYKDESTEDENDQARDLDDQGLHVQLARVRLGKHRRDVSEEGAEAAREKVAKAALRVLEDVDGDGDGAMGDVEVGRGAVPRIAVTSPSAAAEEGRGSKRVRIGEGRAEEEI